MKKVGAPLTNVSELCMSTKDDMFLIVKMKNGRRVGLPISNIFVWFLIFFLLSTKCWTVSPKLQTDSRPRKHPPGPGA